MATARPAQVFLSYVRDRKTFADAFADQSRFSEVLSCKCVSAENDAIVGGEAKVSKLISECDVFVAFIDGAYTKDSVRQGHLSQAIRLAASTSKTNSLREVVFLILDMDASVWWNKTRKPQADIKAWRGDDPAWLTWVDERGKGPKEIKELENEINDLARQLKEFLGELTDATKEAATESYQVIVLGHPPGDAPTIIETARQELRKELAERKIDFCSVPDGWSQGEAIPELTEATSDSSKAIFLQPADLSTADNAIDSPASLANKVLRVASPQDEEGKQAILHRPAVLWLPNDVDHKAFRKEAAKQATGPLRNPALRTGSAAELCEWLARAFGIGARSPGLDVPLISYETLSIQSVMAANVNIFVDEIIPMASVVFEPAEVESMEFTKESELETCIQALSRYDYGIFAIHNIGSDVDEHGMLPDRFVSNIRTYDGFLKQHAPANGLCLENIIRLGIVATTMPAKHFFRYPKKLLRDDALSQWRFIAVAVEEDGTHIVKSHINSLQVELNTLKRRGKRQPQVVQ